MAVRGGLMSSKGISKLEETGCDPSSKMESNRLSLRGKSTGVEPVAVNGAVTERRKEWEI